MAAESALDVQAVSHRYGTHIALHEVNLQVCTGEIFALLGPNGSGKTTLFRLISTLARVQTGDIWVFGQSVKNQTQAVRSALGVVFQAPSLDPKLTVSENIDCHAALYGITGQDLQLRKQQVIEQFALQERLATPTEQLSGGLKRRVELAKVILHRPRLLLMDEPSTGLDPAARLDLWRILQELQQQSQVTVLMTTHLLEEANKAQRIAIMHQGTMVALGQPSELRHGLGGQVLIIHTADRAAVLGWLSQRHMEAQQVDSQIRVACPDAASLVSPLASEFGERIESLTLGQPSLEDVFIARTGHRFMQPDLSSPITPNKKRR
jgi:ABC-2 type transport system ATP-binding protein